LSSSARGADKPEGLILTADQAIALFQARVQDNPDSPLLHALLGHMYARKARESGDFSAYDRADRCAVRALDLDRTNVSAQVLRAQVLCAGHRFAEGLRLARQVYDENPGEHGILFVVGDAHLERGDYPEAENTYKELGRKDPAAYLASRLARLEELKGHTAQALRLMRRAADEEGAVAQSPEAGAWYETRLAEIHLGAGQLKEAARHYEAALARAPRYYVALAGLGRVRTAQGRFDEAIASYKKAVAVAANLPMLAELGDLYARAGQDFLARLNHEKLVKEARGQPAYSRELALFYCDHDRDLPRALELARQELGVRHDIYTHDALAWALYKNGRFREAEGALKEALKLGTQDAHFFYHAGMIHHRLGHREKARAYLQRALALNPHFSLRGAADARRTLGLPEGKEPPL
jgi:tetratricopeptide (TPR) repeat protein